MAVTARRRLETSTTRRFGSGREAYAIPDLTEIQTKSYARFLQYETPHDKRKAEGLEGVLKEIFPIESYDKKLSLSYLRYELGKPRYEPDECRQLRLTYGRPFRIWLRLNKEQPIEEEVYLGDLPIMLGGGEFIINGAERVVVSQLHRSPGIDFVSEMEAGERRLYSCRVIPERGSWIEINTTKKDSITVRIDQSGKFSVITLLRAMDPQYGLDADILRTFYETTKQKITDARSTAKLEGKVAVGDVVYPVGSERAGEIIVESGQKITKTAAETIKDSGLKLVEIMEPPGHAAFAECWPTTAPRAMKKRCCGFTNGCVRAIRRNWKRPRRCSTKSFTTRIVIAWVASAASASIANWRSRCRKMKWCCDPRTSSIQ